MMAELEGEVVAWVSSNEGRWHESLPEQQVAISANRKIRRKYVHVTWHVTQYRWIGASISTPNEQCLQSTSALHALHPILL